MSARCRCALVLVLAHALAIGFSAGEETDVAAEPRKCPQLADIGAFLIDLDGTMYTPEGLIPGAAPFVEWMEKSAIPFVFLSNSGAKGVEGVRAKFMTPPYKLQEHPIGPNQAYTGASAVSMWLKDHAPPGARLFIVQGQASYGNTTDSFVHVMLRLLPKETTDGWEWRTDLSDDEIMNWAAESAEGHPTFVVLSNDGIVSDEADPVTHKPGYSDWSYSLLAHAEQLLENGATLIHQANDAAPWPTRKKLPSGATVVLDTPGPGPFVELLKAAVYPKAQDKIFTVGKGGNLGSEYMFSKGLELLREQGFAGGLENIAMVGDVLSTDIKGGKDFGVQTILVLTGCGSPDQFPHFPGLVPTCVLEGVGSIPGAAAAAAPSSVLV